MQRVQDTQVLNKSRVVKWRNMETGELARMVFKFASANYLEIQPLARCGIQPNLRLVVVHHHGANGVRVPSMASSIVSVNFLEIVKILSQKQHRSAAMFRHGLPGLDV